MKGLTNLKTNRVVKVFKAFNWVERGQKGSHLVLTKTGVNYNLSIPVSDKTIYDKMLARLIKESGIGLDAFLKMYEEV